MNNIYVARKYVPTYNRNLPVPDIDPRKSKPKFNIQQEQDREWISFRDLNSDLLGVYNLVVSKILSHENGIELVNLRQILMYEYLIRDDLIQKLFNFLPNANGVEFEHVTDNVDLAIVYRCPRMRVHTVLSRRMQ